MRLLLSSVLFVALSWVASQVQAAASAEFPFQFQDGFLRVEVSVDRVEKPLNFLLDTGAGVSVIDREVMTRLGFKPSRPVIVNGVGTNTTGFWPQRIAARVGGVALPRHWLAVDLTALGRACATPVDGLIGADFFRGKVVQIDFRERKIRLLTPEQSRKLQGEMLALDMRRCGLRVPVKVNSGQSQWLRLDTGCAAPLHWVTASINPVHCGRQLAVGLAQLSLPTTNVTVGLGSRQFEEISAVIHEREIFAGEAGLLGNGLLARYARITVDAKAGRLILAR